MTNLPVLPNSPSWFAHPDLMNAIIIVLVLILLWFIRREFSKFDTKLTDICTIVGKKADKAENDTAHKALWQRANNHGHKIECNEKVCKPYTGGLLIHEE